MQKRIEFENGNLIIGYWENSQDISNYIEGKFINPIELTFTPTRLFDNQKCTEYINEIISEIESETKKIIQENNEFYKNFEISIFPIISGSVDPINSNYIGECSIKVESKLKNFEIENSL